MPSGWVKSKAGLSYEDVLRDDFVFDIDAHDVMVFLHIQKTGKFYIEWNFNAFIFLSLPFDHVRALQYP